MNKPHIRSRFVAGAECTYCSATDRVVIDLDPEGVLLARRCLACGKEEAMHSGEPDDQPPVGTFLPIRTRQLD